MMETQEEAVMSLEKAKAYLEAKGFLDHVIELKDSTATVHEAAEALGVQPAMIAKTMSFLQGEKTVLILTEGTAKVDNRKYKDTFHVKAKMIPFDEVEQHVGHAPGGVCPFGIREGVEVYLDESLRQFDVVYPAAGIAQQGLRSQCFVHWDRRSYGGDACHSGRKHQQWKIHAACALSGNRNRDRRTARN